MKLSVAAAIATVVVWICVLHSGAEAASCAPVDGALLRQLRNGLVAGNVNSYEQCFASLSSLLSSPPTYSSSLAAVYLGTLSLTGVSENCSVISSSGAVVGPLLSACNCSTSVPSQCGASCVQTHLSNVTLFLTGGASGACSSTITATAVALLGQVQFAGFLNSLLVSVATVNRITLGLSNLSAVQDSTASMVQTSSLASGESVLLVCAAMFPICNGSSRIPLCPSVCTRVLPITDLFGLFTNISQVPIGALVRETAPLCNEASNSNLSNGTCVTANSSSISFVSSGNSVSPVVPRSSFCLNLTCPFPMRATPVKEHWNPGLQRFLQRVHSFVEVGFPSSKIPFNGSILPCGSDCVAVGFSDTAVLVSRIFLSVFSSLAVVVIICSVTIFFFNRKRLGQRLVRRVLLLFTIAGGMASISFMPAAYGGHQQLLCESDGTLRLAEPGPGDPRCTMGAIAAYFFVAVATGYFVALAHSWFVLIGALDKPNLRRQKTSIDKSFRIYAYDIAYAICALTPALILSIVLLALNGIEANVLNGVCSISVSRNYYVTFYVTYFCVTMLFGVIFLIFGLKRLATQKKGMSGLVTWMKLRGRTATLVKSLKSKQAKEKPPPAEPASSQRKPKFSGMARHDRKLRKELNQLAFQILTYILIACINIVCTVSLGIYLGVQNSVWRDQTEKHILCVVTSCQPETCTPLPSPQTGVIVGPLVVQFASLTIIASWAFSGEFLENVPGIRQLTMCRRDRADTGVSSSEGFESSETPHGSRHNLTVITAESPQSSPDVPRKNGGLAPHTNGTSPRYQRSPLAGRHPEPVFLATSPNSRPEDHSPEIAVPGRKNSDTSYRESSL